MKIFLRFLVIYFFLYAKAKAQNLVSNPGFEAAQKLPYRSSNSINRAKGWSAPKYSSDYYYKGAGRHCGAPKNIFGKQKPHSGNAYAGICTRKKFLEYLQTKLSDTLVKGQEYLIEFYLSRAERSIRSLKEIGIYFTDKKIIDIVERGLPIKPQVDFVNQKGFRSKKKWLKLSATYIAKGNELVMILGHFNYDPRDDKRWMLCHYYVDDVSITPIGNINTEDTLSNHTNTEIKDSISPAFLPKPGETVILRNVFFDTNKSDLLPGSFSELNKLANYLNNNAGTSITINGYTDNTGNEIQNRTLSEARAKAVADYLTATGVDPSRIIYRGYGSINPVSTNNSGEGKQQNRRVEFIITEK